MNFSLGVKALMMIVAGLVVLISPGVAILFLGRKIENYPGTFAVVGEGATIVGLALALTGVINSVIFVVHSVKRDADDPRA
jgi:hypothetical protein